MEWVAQDLLVGVIVTVCVLFSAWRLMTPAMRLRTLEVVGPALTMIGAGGALRRLRSNTLGQLAGGCGTCSHNKTAVHRPGTTRPDRG